MFSSGVVLLLSLVVLVATARWTIRLLTQVATSFGLSDFSVAFVILAVATSLPELFVAISSARQAAGDIVLAVALGSNIVNMTLIVGLAAIVSSGISTAGLHLRRDIIVGGAITMLPILFLLNGVISRLEGVLLLLVFAAYIYSLYRNGGRYVPPRVPRRILRGVFNLGLVFALLAVVVVSADYTVRSSTDIALVFGIPSFLIGLFVLAFGTSLPELTTTLQSALLRKPAMALGNIIGSNVADSALIIGVASLIKPLQVSLTSSLLLTAIGVFISLVLLGYFALSRERLSLPEGILLLLFFLIFGMTILLTSVPSVFI